MGTKQVTVLENNPEVMEALARKLGLSPDLTFHDIYTLDEAELKHHPGTALALITILPLTPTWKADREKEDAAGMGEDYHRPGSNSPIIWFEQTIRDACGSIALLHAAVNGEGKKYISPGSVVEKIRDDAISLAQAERAQMLHDSVPFEEAHQSVANMGDTATPEMSGPSAKGQHFVAFVKAEGRLWELEGCRKGPIDRGELGPDEDVLSPRAIELGLGRVIKLEQEAGNQDLRFSCVAMVKE
ncbi:hypothetical protein OQA88_3850 [Cercophora sp. LCS_1]